MDMVILFHDVVGIDIRFIVVYIERRKVNRNMVQTDYRIIKGKE